MKTIQLYIIKQYINTGNKKYLDILSTLPKYINIKAIL